MEICTVYRFNIQHVNQFLIDTGKVRLLVDTGFPGQIPELGRQLRSTGIKIQDIDYAFITHFHPDHAGAGQELANLGVKIMIADLQLPFIAPMENMMKGKWDYQPLKTADILTLKTLNGIAALHSLGIPANIVHTPGHSDDSCSIVLDSGQTFVGDLMPDNMLEENNIAGKNSWQKLKDIGAQEIFPGHGNPYPTMAMRHETAI